ncbi:MAG: Diguanylate cyclase [Sedimentibacter sp.]|nr:Diguanylate cyclase [Sedimentibacter sp.]
MKQKYRIVTAVLVIVICLLISIYYLYTYKKIGEIYQEETKNSIITIKKSLLKNTVDNLIFEIELNRKNETELYQKYIDRRYDTLSMEVNLSDKEFVDYFINRFTLDLNKDSYLNYWTIILWNNSTNEVIFDPENVFQDDINFTIENLKSLMSYYKIINHGQISGLIGVSHDFIDNSIKVITADKIRKLKFDNGSYIWVHEIINYNGGSNYAIRRVHPSLPETEGMFLSTDMTDIKGNLLYLNELEGIKNDGELFQQYYFQELCSEVISEKISFVKLYKDFDWAIGMGIHINDIQQYVALTNEKSDEMSKKYISLFLFFLVVFICLSFSFMMLLKNWYFKKEKLEIEKENNIDSFTATFTRKYGTNELMKSFDVFKKGGANTAIMMFDIDNFKYINDTFGHDTGDLVLKDVVNTIYKNIRSTDKLVRWGGDEFVGICYDLSKENVIGFGQKLLTAVASMTVKSGNSEIKTTISIGFSYFDEKDETIESVIKRADIAMYRSKEEGRNAVNLYVTSLYRNN